jgi:hypothetical protein
VRNKWPYLALLAFLLGWILLLFLIDPVAQEGYPKCPSKYISGLDCPGCGSSRCVHAMTHLEFRSAFAYNPLAFIAVPVLLFYAVAKLLGFWDQRISPRIPKVLHKHGAVIVLIVVVLFTIIRNLL